MPKARTSPPQIGDDHLAAWRAFLRAHSTMLRRISRDLEEADLPPLGWYDVLASLHEAPNKQLRQVELAEQVLLSHSGLSRLLDRMEKAQVVERQSCPTDRRSFHIGVTSEGERLLGQMWPVYARGVAEDFLPALGSNPCEITQTLEAIGGECDAERERQAEAGA